MSVPSRSGECTQFPAASPATLYAGAPLTAPVGLPKLAHTYSIVAHDPASGDLGVAAQSKFPNVGSR